MDLLKISKQQQKKKGWLKWVLLIAVSGAMIVGVALFVIFKLYYPQNRSDSRLRQFNIKEGESANVVVKKLDEEGIVDDPLFLKVILFFSGKNDSIKAGSYELSPNSGLLEISKIITGGMVSPEGTVTIVEGLSNREIAELFADFHAKHSASGRSYELLKNDYRDSFQKEVADLKKYKDKYVFLKDLPNHATLEGYLFPDTYRVYKDILPEEVITKMLDNFNLKVYEEVKDEVLEKEMSFFEIMTLASIVEKEVSDSEQMAMVAGVYYNRLSGGRKLESDATINYITGKNDPQPLYNDLGTDSSYNTYLHQGLPSGPISNPGLQAIQATINPVSHDYLFFITRLDTGEPIFSKTGKEHLENSDKYLK